MCWLQPAHCGISAGTEGRTAQQRRHRAELRAPAVPDGKMGTGGEGRGREENGEGKERENEGEKGEGGKRGWKKEKGRKRGGEGEWLMRRMEGKREWERKKEG